MKELFIIEQLKYILSFDRPISFEKMVKEARDLLNHGRHFVGNDSRVLVSTIQGVNLSKAQLGESPRDILEEGQTLSEA